MKASLFKGSMVIRKCKKVLSVSTFMLTLATVANAVTISSVEAIAVRTGFDANTLARNDDSSTGAINIGFTANFFGSSFTQAFVNNNGNLTFNSPLSTFTPFGLDTTTTPIIAPFFADVDTRGLNTSPVTYGTGLVDSRNAFAANYIDVSHFSFGTNLNSFQVVLIDRSDIGSGDFDIEFNYDQIVWEAGTASGSDSNGLGGFSARAGFSNGTGNPGTFFELPGSGVNGAFLDGNLATGLINNSLNSNVDGRYIFQARNGGIVTTPVPEPMTILGTVLAGAYGIYRRKNKCAASTQAEEI